VKSLFPALALAVAHAGPGLIVDSFAGGGGASTGIEQATGRPIDIALNHDAQAIAMHRANHPETRHYCQSVWAVDPLDVVRAGGPNGRYAGQPIALAWFSPDCKHFSKAKGGKPREKHIRDLAWIVVHWVERLKPFDLHPRVIMLENVEEFRTWGPLLGDGMPCPDGKGKIFDQWVSKLRRNGYQVQFRQLKACDYGAPTSRKRLFMIARCDGQPIVWPEATHGPTLARPYATAADIIDWSLPCPSIFDRKRPLKDTTLRRIATGLKRFVLNAERPFIVPLTHHGSAIRIYDLDNPLPTVTGANRGEMALAIPSIIPVTNSNWSKDTAYNAAEPLRTITTAKGGEFAMVAAFLAQHNGGPRNTNIAGHPANAPLSTITGRGTQQQIVTSNLVKLQNNQDAKSVEAPLDTILAGGQHFAEMRAFLIKYYGNEHGGHGLSDPIGTVTTRDRFGLVTVSIDGAEYAIYDIGMRMLSARELFAAQGFPSGYIIDPEFNGKPMTKTSSIARCGNAVCPPLPRALVTANLPHLCTAERIAA
jgi:DNA (cytosine-5)-methyltransferase 1